MLGNLFGAPNKETFVTSLLHAIRRAGDQRAIRFDRDRFCLVVDAEKGRLFLSPAYDEYVAAEGRERRGVIERYVGLWLQGGESLTPDTFAEARANLLPRVRERVAFEQLRLGGTEVSFRLLSPDLGVELVYLLGDGSCLPLGNEHLDEWDVSFEEAFREARANLAERSQVGFRSPQPGFFVWSGRDGFESARLLLMERIVPLEVTGEPVALVARCDMLAVTGSQDPPGLTRLVAMAQEALGQSGLLCPAPVVWREGAWQPFMPQRHEGIRRLWLQTRLRDYQAQGAVLAERFPDSRVASYQLARNRDDDTWVDHTAWDDEGEHLLPEAEYLALIREGQTLGLFRRERMVQEGLLEPIEVFPVRYRAAGFPSPEQVSRLR
ncbi:MAG: hypothetical protein AB1758_02725 [Candidatus Eremiobacterota bacterium]